MNEHQVSMAETTFGGRPEADNPAGLLNYGQMMLLGLQRARTAREAIQVMTDLVEQYGYGDMGESISVADPQEAWIFEIVGTGPGGKGGAWAAARIPGRPDLLPLQPCRGSARSPGTIRPTGSTPTTSRASP